MVGDTADISYLAKMYHYRSNYNILDNITHYLTIIVSLLQNGKAIFTDGVDDYASLGDISDLACLANTDKCTMGATVLFWTKFPYCTGYKAIISSMGAGNSPGFCVYCNYNDLR